MYLRRQSSLHFDWLPGVVSACFLFFSVGDLHAFQRQNADREREAARLNNLGTALMSQQQLERAEQKFSDAYQLNSKLTVAKSNQGIALLYLRHLPEAQAALELATAKAPSDPHAWYALGLLHHNQNESQKAVDAFKKVLTIYPSDA